jgi:hypothetical protein
VKASRFQHDLAYVCFSFCGLTALFLSAIEAGLPDPNSATVLLIVLPIVLLPASLGAMLVGIALSLRLWRHWPLLILSGMSIILTTTALLTEFGSTKLFFRSVTVVYGVVVIVISCVWFWALRKRYYPAVVK